jgi:5-formyltetrahydrofolate cyclo-ligase
LKQISFSGILSTTLRAKQEKKIIMTDKESARLIWRNLHTSNTVVPHWGKAAEKLRAHRLYRNAATVFATPGKSLHQARINCLVDGKSLIMPAPSIRKGFFLLPARTIPFKDISVAVTYKGLSKHGTLLKNNAFPELSVELLLTDSIAIDHEGGRIGEGGGFFDLCCALLYELGSLQQNPAVLTFVLEEQISREQLPQDTWDIKMTGAITPVKAHAFTPQLQKPQIYWDLLPQDRIKRIDPLWKIYHARIKA